MAKTKISEYSATAGNNTDINSINLAEGMAPSLVNNAIRQLMAQLKDFQAGTAGDSVTVGGNLSVTGTSTLTGAITATGGVSGAITSSSATITGGTITGITDLAVADGGTGASTAANARTNLSAAASGANSDITSITGLTTALTVLQGGTGVTTSTGTGNVVLSTSPTLVTPALGTPSALVGTNITGTASGLTAGNVTTNANLTGGVTSVGNAATVVTNANLTGAVTSVGNATSLGSFTSAQLLGALTDETGTGSAVFATSPTLVTPALGTPSALVGTNITGTAAGLTAGNVTTNANLTGAITSVGNAASLGSFTSANLLAALTDETGTGSAVFATSPTLVTPILGTPTSATLTNATGLPISTGVSGLGTGVATALAVNVGSAGAPVVNGGVLGTPSSGTATNLTGLPISTGVSGLGTGVATFLATPSSANLLSALTDETGTGVVVFSTSPTLVTPILGTPTSATLTNATGLPLSTGVTGQLPVANGGTGTATPSIVAGTNVTVTGTWPNQTIAASGGGGGTPSGSTTQVQYNNAGAFGGITGATSNGTALTLVAPVLGTPASATLTNATGLPISTGVSGLGTGIATALAVNTGSSGAPVINGGALGTPTSGTVTNLTGTASININGTVGATTPSTGAFTSVNTPDTFGFKNRIINGDMRIDQRNAGASVTPTDGLYTLDRYVARLSQASKFSVQQSTTAATGFINSLKVTSASSYSVLAGDYFAIQQNIEGLNCTDLGWGTASAKTVTLSFQVYSSLTGTFGGALSNNSQNRSYPFTYSISTANTWTTISVTIAGDTSGTWLTTNSVGIMVFFGLGMGSTYSGTAGAWSSSAYLSATGAVSVVGTNGATFYITGVQLEKGSTATSFDVRDYGRELIMCQRYFQTLGGGTTYAAIATGSWISLTDFYAVIIYPVIMRAAPTITFSGNFVAFNVGTLGSLTSTEITTFGATIGATGGSGGVNGSATIIRANNSTASRLTFSSEL